MDDRTLSFMPSVPVYPPGTTINDRYELRQKLGSDGHVYEAFDRTLQRVVALKLLHPEKSGLAQPWDEAQRLEHLRSRFLIDVLNADVIVQSDIRYIATPLVTGGDLEAAARPCGLWFHDAVRFAQQVASGIDRIHAAGMVHRDIKPANVLRNGDNIFVSDLQFCEIVAADGRAERNGSWCTLAPETAADHGYCSVKSDVYSLGATTFYLLSGEYPVDHRLPLGEQKDRIERGELREIRIVAPHVSQAVGTVVRKAVHFDPDRRFESAEAFANALAHAAGDTRNWRRVEHQGHVHCCEGDAHRGRAAVRVCCVPAGDAVTVEARQAESGRRIANLADASVSKAKLANHLQRLVRSLG
ncbi:serine/threonine-protein kinase [Terrabacter sp. GCM10028922]|uniref:serine/threonine-protein kinase n=1 Tax=Terrabacter sp. GCM10028922 TaxID=3273428 RepID=UPI003616E441